ncbi:MAG: bacterial Ig-like domain-containing protein [Candidatus Staskawiczbacteria bacterium]|nr:bacterial Ig-like domain-containing protein [Candidatus Staskawiczbacteria bacterium]
MNKGFTIIELIISIFILSVAVVGIFSAFSIITILTSDSSDRLTATYLAQEGMEIVRNIRDQNWLNMDAEVSGATWLYGITSSGSCTSTGCEADYKSTSLGGSTIDYLNIETGGFYSYAAGTATKFKRRILIDTSLASYVIKVTVQVSWNKKANVLDTSGFLAGDCNEGKNCITAEETLYNWYRSQLQSIAITTPASKTIYTVGDLLDLTGLVVTGTYDNGTTAQVAVTPGNISGFDTSAPIASEMLTINVEGQTVTYTITVNAP